MRRRRLRYRVRPTGKKTGLDRLGLVVAPVEQAGQITAHAIDAEAMPIGGDDEVPGPPPCRRAVVAIDIQGRRCRVSIRAHVEHSSRSM